MRLLMQPNRIENVQQKTEDQKPNNDKQKKKMKWIENTLRMNCIELFMKFSIIE